VLCIVTYAIFR
jgi:hypothetical protein